MVYLLDTSALLVLYRKEPGAEKVAACFDDPAHEILICALSLAEFGRKLGELGKDAPEVETLLNDFLPMFSGIVDTDQAVAMASLRLLDQVPSRLPLADSLIAAAALTRSACLMHRDKHLADIPEQILPQVSLFA